MTDQYDALRAHDTDAPARYAVVDPVPTRTDPLRILATVAACYDTADAVLEQTPTDPDAVDQYDGMDRDDIARMLAYRVMSTADRLARSGHTWWHGDRVTGDTDPTTAAPDQYRRVESRKRPTRTRKGRTTAIVQRHGRAYVVGRTDDGRPSPAATMTADRIDHGLRTAPAAGYVTRHGADGRTYVVGNGVDGIAVSRMTAVAYPGLPRLQGADTVAWEEWQTGVGAVRTGVYRPARHETRYGLDPVTPRNGEQTVTPSAVDYDGTDTPSWSPATVTRLVAPDPDPAYAWRGHVRCERPDTVREQRAANAKPVDDAVTVRPTDDPARVLAELAGSVPSVPYRITWTWSPVDGDAYDGAVTVTGSADKPRLSVTGLPSPVRNYATADGLATAIARALAS